MVYLCVWEGEGGDEQVECVLVLAKMLAQHVRREKIVLRQLRRLLDAPPIAPRRLDVPA